MGFKINEKGSLVYLTIPDFSRIGLVKHCFTTRRGGVSEGQYSSLNTSPFKTDFLVNVYKNLGIVCSSIGIDYRKLIMAKQIHGDNVKVVDNENKGKVLSNNNDIKGFDAMITNKPGIPLITFYADCVPIYILDPMNRAIGLIHSGWRSTVLHIGAKTLSKMKDLYGTKPEECLAAIGPSIEKDCFEVGEDTAEAFRKSFKHCSNIIFSKGNGKYNIDLWECNKEMLIDEGVKPQNITISGLCTKCNEELFFSHRRDEGKTGSLSAIMELI